MEIKNRKAGYHPHTEKRNRQRKQKCRNFTIILRTLILILVGGILGINLYLANARGIVGNQLPMPFGYGLANVLSGSMEPTFSPGTLLLVKKTDSIEKGDIVVYQSGQSLVVHRVRAMDGDLVITQGDANNTSDDPFFKEQIRGKVIAWIPYMGNIAEFLRNPAVVLVILILVIVLLEKSFRREQEDDEKELAQIREEIRRLKQESGQKKRNKPDRDQADQK